MLFNSYEFIFLFLLPVLFVFWILRLYAGNISYLIFVSVLFYAQWSLEHLFILLSSVLINFVFAREFVKTKRKKVMLFTVITLNIIPLVYYKYSNFLNMVDHSLVLPLAISFFTFQQIAFQVDLYRKKIELGTFREYIFFILFFPQLVAGPIVHYNELMPQIKKGVLKWFNEVYFGVGITLFSIGLFKKVVVADNLAVIANHSFGSVNNGLGSYDAWIGIFAYSFQIYFDFSGYADMAIGLALLFGITLPINFNSPYKSRNIIEFWRNWHITLSNFLKEHIYIPLGGNRSGAVRASFNLLATMIIGGIWHGAGWTFLLWGLLHGLLLVVVHLMSGISWRVGDRVARGVAIFFTFFAVTLLWVLFRADSFGDAMSYYEVLFGFSEAVGGSGSLVDAISRNEFLLPGCGGVTGWVEAVGGSGSLVDAISRNEFLLPGCGGVTGWVEAVSWSGVIGWSDELLVLFSLFVVWFLPNSLEFTGYIKGKMRVTLMHSFVGAFLFFAALKLMASSPAQTFVYFNF